MKAYPLKVFWEHAAGDRQDVQVRIGFSVPKKKIPRAVDRNLVRRRLREAYRMNKQALHDCAVKSGIRLSVMILYLPEKILTFGELEEALRRLLDKLCQLLNKTNHD